MHSHERFEQGPDRGRGRGGRRGGVWFAAPWGPPDDMPGPGLGGPGGPTVCGSEVRLDLVAAVPGGAEVEAEDGVAAEAGDGLGAVTYAVPSWLYCLNALCTGTR